MVSTTQKPAAKSNVDTQWWPLSRCCLPQISPCGIGATCVTLLICEKFWHILHFGSSFPFSGSSAAVCGGTLGGNSMWGSSPLRAHSSLTRCWSSSNVSPAPLCVFCARVVGDTHFNCPGSQGSMMSASSMACNFSCRY